jgi:phosphoesterase RecJ-like protein
MELEILNGLEFTRSGKIATIVVTQEMIIKTGAQEDDLEDIAAIHGQIEGVVVSITIREQKDMTSKISVRSNHEVDSGAICAILGGGGHFMAAGATVDCGVWEAKDKILKAVDEVWK